MLGHDVILNTTLQRPTERKVNVYSSRALLVKKVTENCIPATERKTRWERALLKNLQEDPMVPVTKLDRHSIPRCFSHLRNS